MAFSRGIRFALGAVLLMSALASACGSGKPHAAPTTSVSPTPPTTHPRPVRTTTTTVWKPTAPQLSPDAAAEQLVARWAVGDRAGAAAVASPAAVAALFSQPYPSGNLQFRGCTQGANPATCTYRNTQTDGIYEISVVEAPAGWFVSSVTPET